MRGVSVEAINQSVGRLKPSEVLAAFQPLDSMAVRSLLIELRNILVVKQLQMIHEGTSVADDSETIERLEEGRLLLNYLHDMSLIRLEGSEEDHGSETSTSNLTP